MKSLVSRLLWLPLVLAALYLVTVNLALNLPATQNLLNGLQPERFAITWQRAWSWYPFRVELRGLAADGQTATEQWQVDAARAAASVSLLPLLRDGTIRVHDLDLADIDLRLRPRPKARDADAAVAAFYPVIRNRDPAALAEPPPETEAVLRLEIDAIHVQGRQAFWVSHTRGTLTGEVLGSLSLDTEVGRVGLAGGALDLRLESLQIADDAQVSADASVKGRIEVPPFRIAEAAGLDALRIPAMDVELNLPVQNLDFLPWLMGELDALSLHGKGRLRGRVIYHHGDLLGGSVLSVDANELAMHLARYAFTGDGAVELRVDPEDELQADLVVRFNRVEGHLLPESSSKERADAPPLFVGQGLEARLHTRTASKTGPNPSSTTGLADGQELSLQMTIPAMAVPDISVYNNLLPQKWPLGLLGGTGALSGQVTVAPNGLSLALDLGSDEADLRWQGVHANSDLSLQLRAQVAGTADGKSATLDLRGTTLRVDDAEVTASQTAPAPDKASVTKPAEREPWRAELRVDQGTLRVPAAITRDQRYPVAAVAKAVADQGLGALLGRSDGDLSTTLTVSRLDWVADLLHRPLGLDLHGTAQIDAEIHLDDGMPVAGTRLRMPPASLALDLLEHRVIGQGGASLTLEHAGKHPLLRLAVGLNDAELHRRDEAQPSIGEVRLDATVAVKDPLGDPARARDTAEVTLKLHSARVRDMATYNAYLPPSTPVSLVGGEASLLGDLRLGHRRAAGSFLLQAQGVRIALPEAALSGDLKVEVLVRDGSAADMRFDVTGSSLTLDRVRVAGAAATSTDWHGRLQLEDTEVVWRKPVQLDMRAGINLLDSRPFVALLDDVRGEHPWIDDLLTVRDLGGHVQLAIDGQSAVLKDTLLNAATLGLHAKGHVSPSAREAMLLMRWHNLEGALELSGEHKHFDLADARVRFDAWQPGVTPLPYRTAQSERSTTPVSRPTGHGPARSANQPATPETHVAEESQSGPFFYFDP